MRDERAELVNDLAKNLRLASLGMWITEAKKDHPEAFVSTAELVLMFVKDLEAFAAMLSAHPVPGGEGR